MRAADTVVLGGGTAGSAVAGLLAEDGESVLLLEAGPDFGRHGAVGWPSDLLDVSALGYTETWSYDSADTYPHRTVPFERARVIGGCSSHNGCAAIWGSRHDYDGWARFNPGWSTDELLSLFEEAARRMRVRRYDEDEITPFHAAVLAAAPAAGIPLTDNLNNLDQDLGLAASPANIVAGQRWNAAFAYLDPVRDRWNLTIIDQTTVDRLLIEADRVVGVVAIGPNGPFTVDAGRIVVAAGTYGSPAILLRSGIGDPDLLRGIQIPPTVPLRGVGANLHDHPSVVLAFAGTDALRETMAAYQADHWMPEEQTIAKFRSVHCEDGFDLHLYPVGGPDLGAVDGWAWRIPIACMTPRSRGQLSLRSRDPLDVPIIDHGYLSDVDGHDRAVLIDGISVARRLAAQSPLRELLGPELDPSAAAQTAAALVAFVDATVGHYYHPVGTCKMGPASDPSAVVNARGGIHGLTNAFVADCSIMPTIPRANTNMPAIVVGERIGRWLRRG